MGHRSSILLEVSTSRLSRLTGATMKLFLLTFLLPVVLGGCPTMPKAPECKAPNKMCGGQPGSNGCPTARWCKRINPFGRCSRKAFCPLVCRNDQVMCSGGMDYDGCPKKGRCISKTNGKCPAKCPAMCGKGQKSCPMPPRADGCPAGSTCMPHDPTAICSRHCPKHCPSSAPKRCPGRINSLGCPGPDTCMPASATCPPVAPPS